MALHDRIPAPSAREAVRRKIRIVLGATAAMLGCAAQAQSGDAARHWQGLTTTDVEAAYRMLIEDHPGAHPELGDEAFRRSLEAGYALARSRVARVDSLSGYMATMLGFANGLGDKHIWSRFTAAPAAIEWAGIVIGRQGSRWIVTDDTDAAEGPSLAGASLVSCDGVAVDRLAEERLGGFRAVWSIPAQRIQAAPWLLVDDANPFLVRPRACTFEQADVERHVALNWRAVRRSDLVPRLTQSVRTGSAGFGARRSGEGYWIALESLSDSAEPVVEAVRSQAGAIRAAPYVVLDLRGNSGGNSIYGTQIAEAIVGAAALEPVVGDAGAGQSCNVAWRASPRNMEQLRQFRDEIRNRQGSAAAEFWDRLYQAGADAQAAGRSFTGPTSCGAAEEQTSLPRALEGVYPGRLMVLTDHACFSSCLLVTDQFRKLGALHVGMPTDAATRYFEVRQDLMPSGLSVFSTLQAVSPASPAQIGPFYPHVLYEGDIADTAALEAWIGTLAASAE